MRSLGSSIASRSEELSRRKRQGFPIDSGHTGRLAAERRTLERCQRRYKALGCDKDDSSPNPVPVPLPIPDHQKQGRKEQKKCTAPARIPIGQSQAELDSQAEAAKQYYIFWQKVTFGGYLVGSVLTGGALFGGAGAAGLVPALVH